MKRLVATFALTLFLAACQSAPMFDRAGYLSDGQSTSDINTAH